MVDKREPQRTIYDLPEKGMLRTVTEYVCFSWDYDVTKDDGEMQSWRARQMLYRIPNGFIMGQSVGSHITPELDLGAEVVNAWKNDAKRRGLSFSEVDLSGLSKDERDLEMSTYFSSTPTEPIASGV